MADWAESAWPEPAWASESYSEQNSNSPPPDFITPQPILETFVSFFRDILGEYASDPEGEQMAYEAIDRNDPLAQLAVVQIFLGDMAERYEKAKRKAARIKEEKDDLEGEYERFANDKLHAEEALRFVEKQRALELSKIDRLAAENTQLGERLAVLAGELGSEQSRRATLELQIVSKEDRVSAISGQSVASGDVSSSRSRKQAKRTLESDEENLPHHADAMELSQARGKL